jgi:hypothetical protein
MHDAEGYIRARITIYGVHCAEIRNGIFPTCKSKEHNLIGSYRQECSVSRSWFNDLFDWPNSAIREGIVLYYSQSNIFLLLQDAECKEQTSMRYL